jgi:hypothetical protein
MADDAPVTKLTGNGATPGLPGYTGDSSGPVPPSFAFAGTEGETFRNIGSSGLRQSGGYVRDEYLSQLLGTPRAMRIYREMGDNSPIIAGLLFAIRGVMRKVQWRVNPSDDSPKAKEAEEFVSSCKDDMSDTWDNFINEALSMLQYGFALHEINYKRRLGPKNESDRDENGRSIPGSRYDDGKIGWRSLPLRGQDSVQRWYFDDEACILGVQQQPWQGSAIDIPIEKLLLFRPSSYKGNPEGHAIIRAAYRPWYFIKRLEEQEGILFERMGGIPVLRIPSAVINAAQGEGPAAAAAQQVMRAYESIGRNTRIDEQMYILLPSDMQPAAGGGPSAAPQYDFKLETPQGGNRSTTADASITRYANQILMSVMADFLTLGHEARGTQSLAVSKIDLFMQACEGWLDGVASVINRHALRRLWYLNADDVDMLPEIKPDMATQLDPNSLGNLLLHLSQAGMPMFPDPALEDWVRDNMGMPLLPEEDPTAPRPPPFMPLPGQPGGPPAHGDTAPPMPMPGTPEHAALMQQVKMMQKVWGDLGKERERKRRRETTRNARQR